MISIIIPVLNEEHVLQTQFEYYQALGQKSELIFVDGGSTDQTIQIAQKLGKVITSPKGRGHQKDAGARQACHDILFFLHVDVCVDLNVLNAIKESIAQGKSGGCLTLKMDHFSPIFWLFECLLNCSSRLCRLFDGDLGLFVRKDVYHTLGGYPHVPLMEDILFGKQLRKYGHTVVLKHNIIVSTRKWREYGFFKTLGRYTKAYWRLWTGKIQRGVVYE